MADITHLYNWIPKNSGITIEEDTDHLLYIKHNGEIVAKYNQTKVTEEILRRDIKNLEGILITT